MYKENYNLKGKRAFITGGWRGIGLCSADALAEVGASIVISDIDEELLQEGLLKDLDLALKQAEVVGSKLSIAEVSGANYQKRIADGLSNFDGSSLTHHLLRD